MMYFCDKDFQDQLFYKITIFVFWVLDLVLHISITYGMYVLRFSDLKESTAHNQCVTRGTNNIESQEKVIFQLCAKIPWISTTYSISTPHSKKLFQQITMVAFPTLDHVLRISRPFCNHMTCSLDPGESNDYNYSITRHPNNI